MDWSFPCKNCGVKFSKEATLLGHNKFWCKTQIIAQNTQKNEDSGPILSLDYGSLTLNHEDQKSYDNLVKCFKCDLCFRNKRGLNTHVNLHCKYKDECQICGQGFSSKTALKLHDWRCRSKITGRFNQNTSSKPFFLTNSPLMPKDHTNNTKKIEFGQNPREVTRKGSLNLICSDCGEICNSKQKLHSHKWKVHQKNILFSCDVCWTVPTSVQEMALHFEKCKYGIQPCKNLYSKRDENSCVKIFFCEQRNKYI